MKKLKRRWGIESNLQLIVILIVFAVTGSASVYVARPILEWIGLTRAGFSLDWWDTWAYWILRILIVFPVYQLLLVFLGGIFGQFRFFWNFEKKMLSRMGLQFLFR
jgi:hypothetical protein